MEFDEHVKFGRMLARLREDTIKYACRFNKTSKQSVALVRLIKALDHAKSKMDDDVFRTFPEKSSPELWSVYYPNSGDY